MRTSSDGQNFIPIPGYDSLIDNQIIDFPILALLGSTGCGKTMYCRQFLLAGQSLGQPSIFLSSTMTEKQFVTFFSNAHDFDAANFRFLPISRIFSSDLDSFKAMFLEDEPGAETGRSSEVLQGKIDSNPKNLLLILEQIQKAISSLSPQRPYHQGNHDIATLSLSDSKKLAIRLVFDSMSYLEQFYGEKVILKFITALSSLLRSSGVMALFTFSVAPGNTLNHGTLVNSASAVLDGVVEMKFQEEKGTLSRSLRVFSVKGHPNTPTDWARFKITETGQLAFEDQNTEALLTCFLCRKPIKGKGFTLQDKTFDSSSCMETFNKLSSVYGSGISPSAGLPTDVVNLHFFFIDIVGLSDPSLSVKRQLEKISTLNTLVRSCSAFKRVPRDKKIVLPTGDGMAIGYMLNAELPLQLAIQLHKLLKSHNARRNPEDKLGARIGISSGHVFIHDDINENQNVWGPGIILARRVMDLGDNLHILVEGNMAKALMDLKDEYRQSIKELKDYRIKHGQVIRIFSAFSDDYGNPEMPARLA